MKTIDAAVTGRRARGEAASAEVKPFEVQGPPPVYTVSEFCHQHHISVGMYYKLRAAGLAPREMVLGRRRLISAEAAAEWRRARERCSGDDERGAR
jgi:hypothetical protein